MKSISVSDAGGERRGGAGRKRGWGDERPAKLSAGTRRAERTRLSGRFGARTDGMHAAWSPRTTPPLGQGGSVGMGAACPATIVQTRARTIPHHHKPRASKAVATPTARLDLASGQPSCTSCSAARSGRRCGGATSDPRVGHARVARNDDGDGLGQPLGTWRPSSACDGHRRDDELVLRSRARRMALHRSCG